MRAIQEIQQELNSLKEELKHAEEWAEKAHIKYWKDREFWGYNIDNGEVMLSQERLSEVNNKISILKWVLYEQEQA